MSLTTVNDRLAEAEEDAKDSGYIIGTVVENVDPVGIGRIKVSVPNLFEPHQGDVPWVGPHKKSPFGIGSGYGVYGSPAIGSQVRIKLQDGDAHYPLFEADEYSKQNANPKFKDPKTWGFKDPSGNELFVNMDTQDWQFTHSSGLTLQYDVDGNLRLHVPGDSTTDIQGDETKTVAGDSATTVTGDITDSTTGNVSHSITGNLTLTITGNISISSSGHATITAASGIDISSAGVINITGSMVNLNP